MFARLVFLALAMGAAAAERAVRMEPEVTVFSAPSWTRGVRVTSADEIKLQFFLKHSTEQRQSLEDTLMDRATPSSANYGKWLSGKELTELVAAPRSTIDAVVEFILSASTDAVPDVHIGRHQDMLSVTLAADAAEALLATELYHYGHRTYPKVGVIRAGGPYYLPESLASKVSLVGELIRLPAFEVPKPITAPEATMESDGDGNVTANSGWAACGSLHALNMNPVVIQESYGYPNLAPEDVAPGNSLALVDFQGSYFDPKDFELFASQCGLAVTPAVAKTYCSLPADQCESITAKDNNARWAKVEKIEYAGAAAPNIPLTMYFPPDLLDWLGTVGNNSEAELVHAISDTLDENLQQSTEYMYSVNTELAKLGAKGLTIVVAAGDFAVWGSNLVNAGNKNTIFTPVFPASSPYVTSVGATTLKSNGWADISDGEEEAWIMGGGGFSNTFGIPAWQLEEVTDFVNQTDVDEKYFNASGRGFPDVSGLVGRKMPDIGDVSFVNYAMEGKFVGKYSSTSISSSVFAGIVAQLNNVRLAAGGAQLGFMNPWIYANDGAFNDVTHGRNDGGMVFFNPVGFTAVEGWDAATGYGTPNFAELVAAL